MAGDSLRPTLRISFAFICVLISQLAVLFVHVFVLFCSLNFTVGGRG